MACVAVVMVEGGSGVGDGGIATRTGVFWAFLYRLHGDTIFLDLSSLQESPNSRKLILPAEWSLQDHLHPFTELERRFDEVIAVYEATVIGTAAADSLALAAHRVRKLREAVVAPSPEASKQAEDFEPEDAAIPSDCGSEGNVSLVPSIDSMLSDSCASSSDSCLDKPTVEKAKMAEYTREARLPKRPYLWCNSYFFLSDNAPNPDLKMRMFMQWTAVAHMGHHLMSKTVTPTHFGETRDDPRRSIAILKAWVLWRANRGGWDLRHPIDAGSLHRWSLSSCTICGICRVASLAMKREINAYAAVFPN